MLSKEENEIVTRVGPGTPMGKTMRRYWLPALLASEIPDPDCAPARVRLLGEDLVAFRDSEGRIGLLDELCPHRLASLYFGRNEECGLRCVYHGWKFDVEGACVDMMNEPEENDFKHKIHIKAYPTVELGGLIWAYMGPPEKMPPAPKFAWTQAPEIAASRHQGDPGKQLAAGAGRRARHLARADHAPGDHRRTRRAAGFKPSNPFVRRQGAEAGRRSDRLRLPVCRHPASGRDGDARPRLSLHPAVPSDPPVDVGDRLRRWTPATSGCRWMTTTRWCSTGSS